MKEKLCLIAASLCLLLACGCDRAEGPSAAPSASPVPESAAPGALPTQELSQRERDWLEDIEALREACKTQHTDPFYLCSEEEFDFKVDQLSAKVGELSDNDIALEIAAIVAELGDPFNSWYSQETFRNSYFIPAFLDWAGCDYKEGYTFQILNENREVESVEIPVVGYEESAQAAWKCTPEYDSLLYLKGRNRTEYVEGPNGGCVYLSLAQLMSESDIQRMIREAGELLAAHPDCGKLVIDMRRCPGGNAKFLSCFQEDAAKALETEHVYVLTSGYTASASMTYIAHFKDELGAVTVGEPTGQFTSMFHMQTSVDEPTVLPHSQISVQLSNAWWDGEPIVEEQYDENGRLYPWESMILPDVYVYQDIDDIRQGVDSVIQWVLAQ